MADTDTELKVDGQSTFLLGMDSFVLPDQLPAGRYVQGMNLICRGGLAQTRPGTATLLGAPAGEYLQGFTFFKPNSGVPQLVFAINGNVYVSNYPFTSYALMPGVQFSSTSREIAWAPCLVSSEYDNAGILQNLANPYQVLMMQDGVTRAAVWDGAVGHHLNPTPSNQPNGLTMPGFDETPVGLWMVWSNNRLWLSQGGKIIASDPGTPLKFMDTQFIAETRAFYIPGNCTGVAESADHQGVWAFTESTGTYFQAAVHDRTLWASTLNFYQTLLKKIGCVAPRSIVQQYGMLWWYSARGLISMDDALRLNVTSTLSPQDNAMFAVKYNMSDNLGGICGVSWENIMAQSVPNGDKYNRHTLIMDQAPAPGATPSWPSYWTGWRPVEWCTGIVNGYERVFFASKDYDGNNRIWEANLPDKTDNGSPITCYLVGRDHTFDTQEYKKFKYAEVTLAEIVGEVSFMAAVSGVRGAFQPVMHKEIVSDVGQVYDDVFYGSGGADLAGSRPQNRVLYTNDSEPASDLNKAQVESDDRIGLEDKALSMLFVWSGILGVRNYRMFAYVLPAGHEGKCEPDETSSRLLNAAGSSSNTRFDVKSPFESYTGTFTYSQVDPATGLPVSQTATITSIISQADADRRAQLAATNYVLDELGII